MTTQQIARLDALIAHFRDLVIAYMEAGDRPAAQRALGQHERLKALRVEILTASVAASAAPPDAGAAAAEPQAAAAALTWSDEFDGPAGSAPNAAYWNHETGGGGWGNNELQTYVNSRNNSALDGNGNLVITARQEGGGYTSARLTTKGKVQPQYGRLEARIKIPRGQGIWPAFWMLGGQFPGTPWPDAGEIDIMENIGREPHIVHGTLHGPGYFGGNPITGSYMHPQGWSFADDFHTFAIDWSPNSITWLVDGVAYQTFTSADTRGNPWVYNQPFFFILNVAVGGNWPGYPDGSTQFPQQMVVDYVRVYDSQGGGGSRTGRITASNDICLDVAGAATANGTYTYTRDGKVIMKGSKSYYTHATTYDLGTVKYHKSLSAAEKATDKYQAKTGIIEIHEA